MGLFTSSNERQIKKLRKIADLIESLSDKFKALSDDELKSKTAEFKSRLVNGETLDDILPEAFATVREAGERVLGMRHFYVQLMGGIVLHQGRIAEMRTGEGKTLVATLPAYLNALEGKGMHVVTVNEYLASRDSEWMGKLYNFLGLTVAVNLAGMSIEEKKKVYSADIVYGTNNEFGFDYLRDNLAISKENKVQRGLNFAIVDEVDSILIDEARTPLIISGAGGKPTDLYVSANRFAKTLKEADYILEEKENTVRLSESGVEKAERFFGIENLSDFENSEINNHVYQAIRAHFTMKRDVNYIVRDGEVLIVDEFTGRIMAGRRYSEGLHQALEAKENVKIQNENRTVATITFQNYFRMYEKLSGMTGTAKTEEDEFRGIYGLDVVELPTNKPMIRVDETDTVFVTKEKKIEAIIEDIYQTHKKGQPVLVGTGSVEKSEELSRMLMRKGLRHNVLNAKKHAEEAEIVAQAGKLGAITISTNMAGRGTDIMLGGNPGHLAEKDMQREGFSHELIVASTSMATTTDEEVLKARQRYAVLYKKHKELTDKEKEEVQSIGGLRIIGTERHESRRIDNQLRGRSGRQGDPGSSIFYLSMEDDLLRIFGGDRLKNIALALHFDESTPIKSKIITRQIEGAQKRREGANYAMRKHVLSYDDVMNAQRLLMYGERDKVLNGEDIHNQIIDMTRDFVTDKINEVLSFSDVDEMNAELEKYIFPQGEQFLNEDNVNDSDIVEKAIDRVADILIDKKERFEDLGVAFDRFERDVMLRAVDVHWRDQIDAMDSLRKGITLRAYGQHDPVIAYKEEATDMFNAMIDRIKEDTVRAYLKAEIQVQKMPRAEKFSTNQSAEKRQATATQTVGRNEPCPCGSGRKYKNCCGKN